MNLNFEASLVYLFQNEGGYVDDPADRGGPTRFGITLKLLERWRKKNLLPAEIQNLTKEEAAQIYKAEYWDTLLLDEVKDFRVACAMFDLGVVRGIGVSARYAQEACCQIAYQIKIDKAVGPATIAALNFVNPAHFVTVMAEKAERGFRGIVQAHPLDKRFLKGWEKRARRLLTLRDLDAESFLLPKSSPLT